jgi:hypothetical protein
VWYPEAAWTSNDRCHCWGRIPIIEHIPGHDLDRFKPALDTGSDSSAVNKDLESHTIHIKMTVFCISLRAQDCGTSSSEPCRSQWSRGLNHELSSLSRTLGSWVQIPLKAWMSMFVCSVFMLLCVWVVSLRWADPPSKESYRLCIGLRK